MGSWREVTAARINKGQNHQQSTESEKRVLEVEKASQQLHRDTMGENQIRVRGLQGVIFRRYADAGLCQPWNGGCPWQESTVIGGMARSMASRSARRASAHLQYRRVYPSDDVHERWLAEGTRPLTW
jgi:hypothetical protein